MQMSKRQSSNIDGGEEEQCSSKKKQPNSDIPNSSSHHQSFSKINPSVRTLLDYISLKEELKKTKMDYQKIEKEKLEEKQRADEAMAEVEKLKYELEDKTDKNAQLEKQNSEIAEQLMDEKEKNKAEIKAFVKKIDVVKKDLENEKKIGDEAKMRVNELQQRLPELHKIIQDEKDGKEKVKTELSESQNLLKLKEALISDLQKMNDEKIGEIKKAQTVSKAFQDEIVQFQAEVADLKEEVLKWKITCDSYRRKKNELSDKNEKKKDVIEENVKEIRNLKKMLDKCGNKDKSILNVQQKQDILKDESLNKSSILLFTESSPKWIVPEKLCENILASNSKISSFLPNYINELFKSPEFLLPEEKLCKEKLEEVKEILLYFFKSNINEIKEMFFEKFKTIMSAKRSRARNSEYKQCNETLSIGITSDGQKFYYSLKSQYRIWSDKWKPYTDKECQNIIKSDKISSMSSFDVPNDYASLDYIIVIEKDKDGQKIHQMTPSTGYTNTVFYSKSKNEK